MAWVRARLVYSWMKVNFPENPENYGQGSCWLLQAPKWVQGAKTPEKYEIWGFPDHPEMKIFTLFLGIKVLMSTSNFMIFHDVEYYKTWKREKAAVTQRNSATWSAMELWPTVTVAPGKVVFFLRVWVHLTWFVSSLCNHKLFFPEYPYFIVFLHMMQKQQLGTSTITHQSLHSRPRLSFSFNHAHCQRFFKSFINLFGPVVIFWQETHAVTVCMTYLRYVVK